jgi:iron-sulfur cluster repair protein YtfE (RIC family)
MLDFYLGKKCRVILSLKTVSEVFENFQLDFCCLSLLCAVVSADSYSFY